MTTGRHVHEDDLTLLHYEELPAAEAREARAHLEGCAECRARQQALARILAMVDDSDTPEPDPSFESQVWRRLQPALREERRTRARQTSLAARIRAWFEVPTAGRLAWAGGVAAIALAAFVAGRFWPASPAGPAAPQVQAARQTDESIRERVLLSALGDHFDRTEAMLVELTGTAPDGRVSIATEQRRAGDLLAATRLYRRAAREAGDAGVADVLDVLQRVLVEVTGSPSELSGYELQALQNRIRSQELLFKLRIASSAVRDRETRTRPAGRDARTGA
jgi:hypothetical protein